MKTIKLLLLVPDSANAETIATNLTGRIAYGACGIGPINGAVELVNDESGNLVPNGQVKTRLGVEWDGSLQEPRIGYSMTTLNHGDDPPVSHTEQSVKVYEHNRNRESPRFIAHGMVTVRNGVPEPVRVSAIGGATVYMSDGAWMATESEWICAARVEPF